ncbi:MAG: leucine-rich repeat domain-containing protein [Bacteroidetes bacterium]|nr:leucine-rich repeat domain-containing protein [Bacteroidota bacterium]
MKHHFGDFLDRTSDYWSIVPNIQRYAYDSDGIIKNKDEVKILTIGKQHENWKQILECPNLEELTLHDPSKEQVQSIRKLTQLKRLRITFFRTTDIEFIGDLNNLEELILEYVSGFSNLNPLLKLTKLKSLHLENLRSVSNFEGLKGLNSLRYLRIDGTVDWSQPIENFEFLNGLPSLEVLSLGFVVNHSLFPALLPVLHLKRLRKIKIGRATFPTKEYAFLQVALPNVEGCSWDLCWDYGDNFEFLGKRAGFVKKKSPSVKKRCEEFIRSFEEMKKESEKIVKDVRR